MQQNLKKLFLALFTPSKLLYLFLNRVIQQTVGFQHFKLLTWPDAEVYGGVRLDPGVVGVGGQRGASRGVQQPLDAVQREAGRAALGHRDNEIRMVLFRQSAGFLLLD